MEELALAVSVLALLIAGASYNLSRKNARRAEQLEYSERMGDVRISHTQALGKVHAARLAIVQRFKNAKDTQYTEALEANLTRSEQELAYLNESESILTQMPRQLTLNREEQITQTFASLEEVGSRLDNIQAWCDSVEPFLQQVDSSDYDI